MRQTVTAYSRAGDVLTMTDPKTQKVETDYDRAGRVTEQRFKRADGVVEETRVSGYDKAGNLKSRTDLHGQTTYAHDALNRVTLETRQTTTAGIEDAYSVASSYDKGGNRSKAVYPGSGRTLVSVYDRANRLTAVQDTAGAAPPRVTTFAYDSGGNRTSSTAANGTVTATTFDALNRVLTHGTKASAAAGAATLYSVVYGYDLAGQRRTASETVATAGARQIAWDYDGLYRLEQEGWTGDVAQTRSYTYDPAGNRLGRTVDYVDSTATDTTAAYAYDALNRLTGYEEGDIAYDYGYDLNGNRTSLEKSMGGSGNYTYTYDTLNRLASADANGTAFAAYYDARTRRLAKTEGTGTTLYRYDGGTSVQELTAAVPAGSGTPAVPAAVKAELVRAGGLGGGIGSVLYTISGVTGNAEHFVYNAVGHTVATTDDSAAVTQATLYEAFGETAKQTGTGTNNRLRNTKERDQSIGLDNDGFRYYDPATGRYVQRDPIGYGDGMNVYASVKNDPVNNVDPLGLAVVPESYYRQQEAAKRQSQQNSPSPNYGFIGLSSKEISAKINEWAAMEAPAGGWVMPPASRSSGTELHGFTPSQEAFQKSGAATAYYELIAKENRQGSLHPSDKARLNIMEDFRNGGNGVGPAANALVGAVQDVGAALAAMPRAGRIPRAISPADAAIGKVDPVAGTAPDAFVARGGVTINGKPQAPMISVQKQQRHQNDWADGVDVNAVVKEAWREGTPFKGQDNKRVYEFPHAVGKNGETNVQTHRAPSSDRIHGHPKEGWENRQK